MFLAFCEGHQWRYPYIARELLPFARDDDCPRGLDVIYGTIDVMPEYTYPARLLRSQVVMLTVTFTKREHLSRWGSSGEG